MVVTEGEEQKKEESKGFAGLSSLVSDVDTTPPPAPKRAPAAAAPSVERPASPQPAEPPPQPSQRQTYQEPSQPSSGSSGKWLLGIAAVIGLLWLINFSNGNKSPTAPAYEPSSQTKDSDRGAGPNKTTELLPPKFSEYLSDIYDGPRAKVNLLTDFDKNFRTRIRNTQSQPINFAGEYILSTWGCGTSCLMGVAVNARTGQVVELPGSVCCWKGAGERTIFKKNSRLLVLAGLINENGQHGAHFYELKNNEFIHIKTIPIKEDELSPPSSTLSPATVAPTDSSPVQIQTPGSLIPSAHPQEHPRPNEEKPPIASNLVLSIAQIHYCLAEDIRLESAKSAANNYIDSDVDRFNAMVADYNSRCSSFQYQTNNRGRNDLNSAQRNIEPFRSQLQSEGRSRFGRSPSTDSLSAPTPSRLSPDASGVPDLSKLSYEERSAIQQACILEKSDGAASYNRCVVAQTHELANAPRLPDLSALSYEERSAIQQACILKKSDGAASYNRCVVAQTHELANAPRLPDLSTLSYEERSAIQQACILKKSDGAASYNRCVVAQLRALGR